VGEGKIERKACFFAVSAVGICVSLRTRLERFAISNRRRQ